jgi:hypothetical protein
MNRRSFLALTAILPTSIRRLFAKSPTDLPVPPTTVETPFNDIAYLSMGTFYLQPGIGAVPPEHLQPVYADCYGCVTAAPFHPTDPVVGRYLGRKDDRWIVAVGCDWSANYHVGGR